MAIPKWLKRLAGGQLSEEAAIQSGTGADRIVATGADGVIAASLLNAKNTTAGAGDANKIPQLGADGRLDESFMPVGIAAETATATASEAISAGNLVNLYNNAGVLTARKADAATNKPAHGYAKAAIASAATGVVHFEGKISGLTGLTPGDVYLGAAGAVTATAPTATGSCSQLVGTATSATEVNFNPDTAILLV